MTRKDLKLSAKSALKGRLFEAFIPILIMIGISGIISIIQYVIKEFAGSRITALWSLVSLGISIFMIPMQVGLATYYLKMTRKERPEISDLFKSYKNTSQMFEQIKAYVLTGLIIFVGLILFIIPGIIWALKYSQLGFAFAENPDLTYDEARRRSAELMSNRKSEFFILGLSFILWLALVPLTFGLILIYLAPYMEMTFAAYYAEISGMNANTYGDSDSEMIGSDGLFDSRPSDTDGDNDNTDTVSIKAEQSSADKDDDIFQ